VDACARSRTHAPARERFTAGRATLPAMDEPIDDQTFEDWVFQAIEGLPPAFRDQLGSVAIVIEEWPTQAQLASVGAAGLYGLYQGVPRSVFGAEHATTPSKITIYRGTLVHGFGTREAIRAKVIDTVRHEIAHHLGISDARLQELAREHHGR
jgi:predicted Zn-dependent protease with MMP-like domain